MNPLDLNKINCLMETYAPATLDDVTGVEKELNLVIPNIYKRFLVATNGATTDLAVLYGVESLVEMNRTYEVQEYAPGYISVGNDNGDYHLMMKAEDTAQNFQLVEYGHGVPQEKDCTDEFEDWLVNGNGDPWRSRPEEPNVHVDLILKSLPTDGKKGLLHLKSTLRLSLSIVELVNAAENLPFTLFSGITLSAAKAKVNNFGENDIFDIRSM